MALSMFAFVGIVTDEGYTDRAVVPTKNDRPTVGFGSTFRDDGTPVQMGDTTNPVQAVQRSAAHIAKDEAGLKRCVTAELSQAEYDTLVDFTYQYGVQKTCASSMVRHINAREYRKACDGYAYAQIALIESGQRPLPTLEAFIQELPDLVWPV